MIGRNGGSMEGQNMSVTTEKWTIFGERLKAELERQGMSLRQFSGKTGITLNTAFRYVHSQRIPRATEILKAAKVLGVTCDYMLGLSDDPHKTQDGWAKAGFHELPSAQPEPCVDTIDALDESIKHFDDMAEECRRNANIEQNDYMDMRDDAAEYRQLSIWLNELKWLRERFQSQPDLSEYSDKLWRNAYERGKEETQQRWIPFKTRPLTEEEKEGHPEWDRILDCKLPEDGQAILISVNLRGHESVQYDEFYTDDGSYLDSGYEIGDEAVAWMPLPEPYAERRTDEM